MAEPKVERVVLIGFSGSGKTTIGGLLADRLGWRFIDTDAAVEGALGMSVPAIFREHGEGAFRTEERRELVRALRESDVVVACGGGATVESAVWGDDLLRRPGTIVVALDTCPETVVKRLEVQRVTGGDAVERPMLAGEDALGRVGALKAERQESYDQADLTVIADNVEAHRVADEIVACLGTARADDKPSLRLRAPSGASEIFVGPGSAVRIGTLVRNQWARSSRVWLITDDVVGGLYASQIQASLERASFSVHLATVPPGEGSKSLTAVSGLYDSLLDAGIERGDVVVALGGGVIGDLAGFVAATVLRGVGLVQVPTTLLAMVDSSVGGKTGINHRTGKNLIGAFYQPPVVVIDSLLLRTLAPRDVSGGWAEIVKHGWIQPSVPGGARGDLVRFLRRNAGRLAALSEPALSYLVRRNVELKAAVVEADEREAGIRAYLNFGHTIGHAIEAAGYTLNHGEAVAVGMRAAARVGLEMGTCSQSDVLSIDSLLDQFNLPRRAGVDPEQVVGLLAHDKKRTAGTQRWVLPVAGGGVAIRDDVPSRVVRDVVTQVTGVGTASVLA
jgi:shikimate kinase/3-dehydroquinate synthase